MKISTTPTGSVCVKDRMFGHQMTAFSSSLVGAMRQIEMMKQHYHNKLLSEAGFDDSADVPIDQLSVTNDPVKPVQEPLYEHDCDKCQYLGQYQSGPATIKHDLYVHCAGDWISETVIARFGDEGDEYLSGIVFVGIDPCLTEAYKRAVASGVVFTKENIK